MPKQSFEPIHLDPYFSHCFTNDANQFYVNDIGFDMFKTGISAGPEAAELVRKRPFLHLDPCLTSLCSLLHPLRGEIEPSM